MSKKYTVATIGAGAIAQGLHLPGYNKREDVDRIVIADPIPERIEEAKSQFRIAEAYSNYADMLAAETPDFVSVCSPNKFHAEHAIAALNAGAHLLLEKPMTLTLQEADAVKAAQDKSGKKVMIGFSHRLIHSNKKIKSLLEAGEVGDPFMMRVRFAHGGPFPGWAKTDWFYDPEVAGGGALLDMGIHAIDLCQWMMGPVVAVSAVMKTLRKDIKLDDNAILTLEFANKALAYIEVGWTSGPGFTGLEIYADNGTVINNYSEPLRVCVGKSSPDWKAAPEFKWRTIRRNPNPESWAIEIDYFMDTILKGNDFPIGIAQGKSAVAVALAAIESAKSGKRQVL